MPSRVDALYAVCAAPYVKALALSLANGVFMSTLLGVFLATGSWSAVVASVPVLILLGYSAEALLSFRRTRISPTLSEALRAMKDMDKS